MAEDESLLIRTIPHSKEAEASVIGAMIRDGDAVIQALEILQPEDFYSRQFQVLFSTMKEMTRDGIAIDFVSLQDKLKSKKDVPPEFFSLETLKNLAMDVPTVANIRIYCEMVRSKAILRALIRTNEEIADMCYKGEEDLESILESTEKKMSPATTTIMIGSASAVTRCPITSARRAQYSAACGRMRSNSPASSPAASMPRTRDGR